MCLFVFFIYLQVFTYLDRWYKTHGFSRAEPVQLIFVVDGMIDRCKVSRNKKHEERRAELKTLRGIITSSTSPEPGDVKRSFLSLFLHTHTHMQYTHTYRHAQIYTRIIPTGSTSYNDRRWGLPDNWWLTWSTGYRKSGFAPSLDPLDRRMHRWYFYTASTAGSKTSSGRLSTLSQPSNT